MVIDTKWKRLKGAIDDPKRGVGQGDVYQMMAYSHVYGCEQLLLLYPHHGELGASEGILALHSIAGKPDSHLGIATIALADPKSVGRRLRHLLINFGTIRRASGESVPSDRVVPCSEVATPVMTSTGL